MVNRSVAAESVILVVAYAECLFIKIKSENSCQNPSNLFGKIQLFCKEESEFIKKRTFLNESCFWAIFSVMNSMSSYNFQCWIRYTE